MVEIKDCCPLVFENMMKLIYDDPDDKNEKLFLTNTSISLLFEWFTVADKYQIEGNKKKYFKNI